MINLEIAGIVAALIQQFCGLPDVIDINTGNRFGEDVLTVTVPTEDEREQLSTTLPGYFEGIRVHVIPLFGIGSLTSELADTKRFESLMFTPPYNIYGTPENKELDLLIARVSEKDREVWASMSGEARRKAIDDQVLLRRQNGAREFGNCQPK